MKNAVLSLVLDDLRLPQQQICEFIREQIRSGKLRAGARLPSNEDLARAWDTNDTTVQFALAALAKEGWLVRMQRRGTFVRQREEKLTCVGICNSATGYGGSLYLQAIHSALKEELAAQRIEMDVWLDPRVEPAKHQTWRPLLQAAERREFQALIVTTSGWPMLRWLARLPVPAAFLTSGNLPSAVRLDLVQFAELSVRALTRQGCRSVGLIVPGSPATALNQRQPNLWGAVAARFLDLARDAGMIVRNQWMRFLPSEGALGGRSQESYGYECFRALWQGREKPEALVAFPDTVARGVILAAQERRVRVPADLKLVLHKNQTIDLLCPMPATFVISSERQTARALIQQAQKQFRGESCEPILIPFDTASNPNR